METEFKNPVVEKWRQEYQSLFTGWPQLTRGSTHIRSSRKYSHRSQQIKGPFSIFIKSCIVKQTASDQVLNFPENGVIDIEEQEWLQRHFEERRLSIASNYASVITRSPDLMDSQ